MKRFLPEFLVVLTAMLAVPCLHAETVASEYDIAVSQEVEEDDTSLGLNLDLGWASAYVFRGLNVFKNDSQMDQHMLLAPGITWSIFDTGLSVGYWGAFGLNGGNVGALVDNGFGAEQDLFVKYDLALGDLLAFNAGLTYYFYPGAEESAAGTAMPSYLEPTVGLTLGAAVDLGLSVSYFWGLQDEIRDFSYLYINPTLAKSFGFGPLVSLDVAFGYGYKVFNEGNSSASNVHDLLVGAALPVSVFGLFYVSPSVNVAWTNIEDSVDSTTGTLLSEGTFGDGFSFWGGVNVGIDL